VLLRFVAEGWVLIDPIEEVPPTVIARADKVIE
jgi:hypothetical protein